MIASTFSSRMRRPTGALSSRRSPSSTARTARGRFPSTEPSIRTPAVRERRERARHLERVDGLRSEPDGEEAVERALDAEPVRHSDDVLRAELRRQLRVHGVVGLDGRLPEIDRAEVLALVVAHGPELVAERDHLRPRHVGRRGRDPLRERRREHERLEGRAGLPLALDGEVELALREARAADHREDVARPRIDRDERRLRPVLARAATCRSPRARASGARGRSTCGP